jgi:hypothetical protein
LFLTKAVPRCRPDGPLNLSKLPESPGFLITITSSCRIFLFACHPKLKVPSEVKLGTYHTKSQQVSDATLPLDFHPTPYYRTPNAGSSLVHSLSLPLFRIGCAIANEKRLKINAVRQSTLRISLKHRILNWYRPAEADSMRALMEAFR